MPNAIGSYRRTRHRLAISHTPSNTVYPAAHAIACARKNNRHHTHRPQPRNPAKAKGSMERVATSTRASTAISARYITHQIHLCGNARNHAGTRSVSYHSPTLTAYEDAIAPISTTAIATVMPHNHLNARIVQSMPKFACPCRQRYGQKTYPLKTRNKTQKNDAVLRRFLPILWK